MMVVVVVLPSEPVTAMTRQGHRSKNTSISDVSSAPAATARRIWGASGLRPGVRKITSAPSSRSR